MVAFLGYGATVQHYWGWVNAGHTHKVFAGAGALFILMVIALFAYQKEKEEREERYLTRMVDLCALILPEHQTILRLSCSVEILNRSQQDSVVQLPEVELLCRTPGRLLRLSTWQPVSLKQAEFYWQWRHRGEKPSVQWLAGDKDLPALRQRVADLTCVVPDSAALLHREITLRAKLDLGEPEPRTVEQKGTVDAFIDLIQPPPWRPPPAGLPSSTASA